MGLVDGMPVGLGVVARALDEKGLVRALSRIESVIQMNDLTPTFIRT
jgi:amidase